jgi:hypothetical protein
VFSEHQQRRGGPPIWIFAIVAGVFIGLMLNLILWLAPAAKRPSSYHQDRSPTHGYEPTREQAMQAFARGWHRE